MKKSFLFLTMLLCSLLFAGQAWAYNLTVQGVQVTDANKADILGYGKAIYNSTTNTLTLTNANITPDNTYGIKNDISGLTIQLVGSNTIYGSRTGIYTTANCTIKGSGSLKITTTNGSSIQAVDCSLTIDRTTVEAMGSNRGIMGSGTNPILTIKNSTVNAKGANNGTIDGFKKLSLVDCKIVLPEGAVYDETKKALVDKNKNIIKDKVAIEPTSPTKYDLTVAGVQVTPSNAGNITGSYITGKISYDHTTRTLTLNNAGINITVGAGIVLGIENSMENLKINLIGKNTINTYYTSISSTGDLSITGDGMLETKTNYVAISIKNCNLTVDGVTIDANCGTSCILGDKGENEIITIKNATVNAVGSGSNGLIGYFKELKMTGCSIVKPASTKIENGFIWGLDGRQVSKELLIAPNKYGIIVAGELVTDINKDNITGTGISGRVQYYPVSNTLTLDNATISYSGLYALDISKPLYIQLVGKNTITTTGATAIRTSLNEYKSLTFYGDGSLDIKAATTAISTNKQDLIIDNTTITAQGAITGNIETEQLTVINSNLTVTGGNFHSISGFDALNLQDCSITKPSDATYNRSKHALVDKDGNYIKGEVVIKASNVPTNYGIKVAGVQVTSANASSITGTGISGKVSYISATNTLTLENATISHSSHALDIYQDLTIQLSGKNTIMATGSGKYAINAHSKTNSLLTIKGSGSANVVSNSTAIFVDKQNMTIDNTTIAATGAIVGNTQVERLTVKKSSVSATSDGFASIYGFDVFELYGCSITKPSGATYDRNKRALVDKDGNILKEEVLIEPDDIGVREIIAENVKIRMQNRQLTVENSDRQPIAVYNVMGQVVATKQNPSETETFVLPAAGVYIVRVGMGATRVIAM